MRSSITAHADRKTRSTGTYETHLKGNATYVDNVCINRFIGIDTGNLFTGLKRIAKDTGVNANEGLIIRA